MCIIHGEVLMKRLMWGLIFVLLLSSVNAALTDDIQHYWKMSTTADEVGGATLTETGGINHTTGIIGLGYDCNDGEYIDAGNITINYTSTELSFNLWVKRNAGLGGGSWTGLWSRNNGAGAPRPYDVYYQGSDNTYNWFIEGTTAGDRVGITANNISSGDFVMLTFTKNGTNYKIFENAVERVSDTNTNDIIEDLAFDLRFCQRQDNVVKADAVMDEVGIWNRTLTSSEVSELYNNGSGNQYPFSMPATLTINSDLVNNTMLFAENLTINYNGTFTNTNDLFNCTLLVNSAVNQTSNNVNLSQQQSFFLDFGMREEQITLGLSCLNEDISATDDGYKYNVDSFLPRIMTSFVNNSQFTLVLSPTLTLDINFTNDNLQNYTINILNQSDSILENIFGNVAGLNLTFAENKTSRSVATYDGPGNYSIDVTVADLALTRTKGYVFEVLACPEDWQQDNNECIDGSRLITYTDLNACGTTNDLPPDNGTSTACTDVPQNAQQILNLFPLILVGLGAIFLMSVLVIVRTKGFDMNAIAIASSLIIALIILSNLISGLLA